MGLLNRELLDFRTDSVLLLGGTWKKVFFFNEKLSIIEKICICYQLHLSVHLSSIWTNSSITVILSMELSYFPSRYHACNYTLLPGIS